MIQNHSTKHQPTDAKLPEAELNTTTGTVGEVQITFIKLSSYHLLI